MNPPQIARPVELVPKVYLLWHPKCPTGEVVAREILAWLRPGANGLGPDVHFRSLGAPDAPAGCLPLPLPHEQRDGSPPAPQGAELQIVIPLIDANMVADPAWRWWVTSLAEPPVGYRVMLPVALDATAYNVPAPLRALNFLRPTGQPPATPQDASSGDAIRSLRKQVTEAMTRVILPRGGTQITTRGQSLVEQAPPKITVFLSHAKGDGTGPARRLRDYIHSQTQFSAFYDENDIAFGTGFAHAIRDDLGSANTAALIAIRSARYAERPWCRRELAFFRTPRPDTPAPSGAERWRLYPTLVVEAMSGSESSGGIAEMGSSPVLRWNADDANIEETILTTVTRNAMLAAFHAAAGAAVPSKAGQVIINWLPDPTTLLQIPTLRQAAEVDVLYPGRGLSGLELDILSKYFPNAVFRSFEEARTSFGDVPL